ncbi:MAG: FAD-dependent oxidoreductase [Clostridia bacterium]|nr:FAD-dependent oxidoreductase [Clostridia bacterium]
MSSIFEVGVKTAIYPPLTEDASCDTLVIGGGIAGILTAYRLKEAGVDCIVAEADRICRRTTANSSAKVTAQHGLIYSELIERYGKDFAVLYLKANADAVEKFDTLSHLYPCDFERCDSYIYSRNSKKRLEDELCALESIGYPASLTNLTPLPFETVGAIRFSNQGKINIVKLAHALARELKIYERTRIVNIEKGVATAEGGYRIYSKRTVVATHFPILNRHGAFFLKMHQNRSYFVALKGAPLISGVYLDEDKSGYSHRSYRDTLLIGGGAHKVAQDGGGFGIVEDFAKKCYPCAEIVAKFAAEDCITLDSVPYIGQYSRRTPHLYVITGFNKWGMSTAMAGAEVIRDLIINGKSEYSSVFDPSRSMLTKTLGENILSSAKGLLTPKKKRCSHLGCALKWNPHERSWDCPCHGSRFGEDGNILDGPANKGVNL